MAFENLTSRLLEDLEHIKLTHSDVLHRASKSVLLCQKVLSTLRQKMVEKGFENVAQEVHFFKNVKNLPLTQLIYHTEIHNFEVAFPKATHKRQKKLMKKRLKTYTNFFLRHIDFGQYIEQGATHFDPYYYTRKLDGQLPIRTTGFYLQDIEFNTPNDTLLAQFKAYSYMTLYLKVRLSAISKGDNNPIELPEFNLKCAASKTGITELAYSLILSGAIIGNIKELVRAFEHIFNIELGDYYRTFIEIRNRTNDPTKFLDSQKMALEMKIKEMDG